MINQFRRRRDDPHTAHELRRRLAEQARRAPDAHGLAELIIARAEREAEAEPGTDPFLVPPRRDESTSRAGGARWGRIAAAAATVAVLAGGGVAIAAYDPGTNHPDAGATTSLSTPAPSSASPSAPPTRSTADESKNPDTRTTHPVRPSSLSNVHVRDVTFTGGGNGWGLASADCLSGPGTCTALLHTSDGGRTWQSRPHSPFQVAGVTDSRAPTVGHIRFATDDIGYVFGESALFLTTDGGRHWDEQDGGADALETLDGNVIRVSTDDSECLSACTYQVSTADVGSSDWTQVDLPGTPRGEGVVLARSGSNAYLLTTGPSSALWSSADDGATWTARARPCARPADAKWVTTAADGAVVTLCRQRSSGAQSVSVSTDDAGSFRRRPVYLGAAPVTALGAGSADVVLVSSDDTYRSTNGGRSFRRLAANANSTPGQLKYLGFASDTDAHAISRDGTTIWTTTDQGVTWTATATFR